MRFLLLLCIVNSYKIEVLSTRCYSVNTLCIRNHVKEVETTINKLDYLSHTTITTKYGMTSLITYKEDPSYEPIL